MITFDELNSICQQNGLEHDAAECHGILSGLVCANGNIDLHQWLILLVDEQNQIISDENLWAQVLQTTLLQLSGDDLDFQLLLPDDEWPLSQRTEALANWCSGFLYGISSTSLQEQLATSPNLSEVIEDFTQISAASYDDGEEDENGEAAYMELAEYIRAAAMLVFTELQSPPQSDNPTLH